MIFFVLCFSQIAFAGETNGDAIYRDGANGYNHAGIYKDGKAYEIRGYGYSIDLDTLTVFKDGQTYYGPYTTSGITSTARSNVLATCAALDADSTIDYTAWAQLVTEWSPGTYVSPSEIDELRCDGVVEYAYEWNDLWVWGKANPANSSGTPQHFDISLY